MARKSDDILGNYKHGHARKYGKPSLTYTSWRKMKERCYNRNDISFPNYGARGIGISEAWTSFAVFLKDMGERPQGTSLDRIDIEGEYSRENCRWSSKKVQANNCRSNRKLASGGITRTMTEWSEVTGVKVANIWRRLSAGWDVERALHQPVRK